MKAPCFSILTLMSILNSLSGAVLRQASEIKNKIEALEVEFAKLLNASAVGFSVEIGKDKPVAKKGGMSAAGRAKIAAAQKARWAKVNAGKKSKVSVSASKPATVTAKPALKKKGGMSAAGRAKIAAAAKARWAKVRAAKAAAAK
jgi:hypothetical protein